MRITREFYIPENVASVEGINPDLKIEAYAYNNDKGQPVLLVFGGKRNKPDLHYRYSTPIERDTRLKGFIESAQSTYDFKQEQKVTKKAAALKAVANAKAGDIYHCSWGYEQTQCDFYELMEIKGQTGTFRPILAETVPGSEGHDCDRRRAVPGAYTGETFKKRLNGETFKLSSFQYVSKVADPVNDSFYCSWYY